LLLLLCNFCQSIAQTCDGDYSDGGKCRSKGAQMPTFPVLGGTCQNPTSGPPYDGTKGGSVRNMALNYNDDVTIVGYVTPS